MRRQMAKRLVAFGMATMLFVGEASAAIKEVAIWGAKSINTMGASDKAISMEDLKQDYSGLLQVDGLTEYFHKDQGELPKIDMNEALAWLIDNGIINRDETITVSNVKGIPSVNITKTDINSKMQLNVNRSDALMYIYKAVFGELDGRTIGVETPNVRTKDGRLVLVTEVIKNGQTQTWKYVPQGDDYTSVFGDTNIYIDERKIDIDNNVIGGSGYEGGIGGSARNDVTVESNFETINYVPGSDILFYRTSDVVEMYLQSILSKGILEGDKALRTSKFSTTFEPFAKNNTLKPAWSGDADPYIVNLATATRKRIENVAYAPTNEVLGANYNVSFDGTTLSINRRNLFQSETGYFVSEVMSRMDAYRYIYAMVYANEKKLSNLEADIVNYKYGMEFNGIAPDEDIEILKYLVAKGILDYDGSSEIYGLNNTITWAEFIPILYRVANKNARLDFSVIQLTDSEQSWKARGFYPQTLYLVEEGAIGEAKFEYDDSYLGSTYTADTAVLGSAGYAWVRGLLSLLGVKTLKADENTVAGKLTYQVASSGAMTYNGYYFDFKGASYSRENLATELYNLLYKVDRSTLEQLTYQSSQGFDINNPKLHIVGYMLKNIYVIAQIQQDMTLYNELKGVLDSWKQSRPTWMSDAIYQAKLGVYEGLRQMLDNAYLKKGTPADIKFKMVSGAVTNTPNPGGDILNFAQNLAGISFTMPDTQTGKRSNYSFDYIAGSAAKLMAETDVVTAVNSSAVEFSKVVTESEVKGTGIAALTQTFTQSIGTSLANKSGDRNKEYPQFKVYTEPTGKDAFVSWASIEEAKKQASNKGMSLPIERISENLLYNSRTGTYAYFSNAKNGANAIALVGTAVVSGDSELGVAFKSGEGEAASFYYHVNAIRLLLDASQESAVISSIRSITLPGETLVSRLSAIPLVTESGHAETHVVGMTALLSDDANTDLPRFASDSIFRNSIRVGNQMWGQFLSTSQANRVMNLITRRFVYTVESHAAPVTAFAVVRFVPVSVAELGAAPITSTSTLQDLLDAPAQPPKDAVAKEAWNRNKAMCNAFANWIYGTSGQTYIETGYLKPEATLYVLGNAQEDIPPGSIYGSLSADHRRNVKIVSMDKIYAGAICSLEETPLTSYATKYRESYWLSKDCGALVNGDRIYLHINLFPGLSIVRGKTSTYAKVTNNEVSQNNFTLGSTFQIKGVPAVLGNGIATPAIKVIQTTSNGMIRCQVGPIKGLPIRYGSSVAVVYQAGEGNDVMSLSSYDLSSANGVNRIQTTFKEMFGKFSDIKLVGVTEEPVLSVSKYGQSYVFTGTHLKIYDQVEAKPVATVAVPNGKSTDTYASYKRAMQQSVASYSTANVALADTYITIEFPALKYRVRDGYLEQADATALEFLSPALFTSLNDLIIDQMINETNGAIPVNEVPAGALLKVGTGYYQAVGSSADTKTFVGYSYMDTLTNKPTIAMVASSFANHFIRAGNQYVNVSHFFKSFTVLGSLSSQQRNALANVAQSTMKYDATTKYSVTATGDIETIVSTTSSNAALVYAPTEIKFSDGLMAYRISTPESSVVRYALCNTTKSSINGAFSNLPFFDDNILDAEFYDRTTDVLSSGFQYNAGANSLKERIKADFQKAFAGDLITLVRMLLFVVLCWLILAGWICYVCRIGNILPILEAIRHPSSNKKQKGVDLFKVVSLGTISLDTEFNLGRFLLYNLILAGLLCVVMLTGRIPTAHG